MIEAMKETGPHFQNGKAYVPELLILVERYRAIASSVIRGLTAEAETFYRAADFNARK